MASGVLFWMSIIAPNRFLSWKRLLYSRSFNLPPSRVRRANQALSLIVIYNDYNYPVLPLSYIRLLLCRHFVDTCCIRACRVIRFHPLHHRKHLILPHTSHNISSSWSLSRLLEERSGNPQL